MCGSFIKDEFVDGKTTSGPWAFMCLDCHRLYGYGLGVGKGQRYIKVATYDPDGYRWELIEGSAISLH